MYDEEEVRKTKYNSEIRGRVQDRNVRVDLEPMFVLTYYEKVDPIKKLVYGDGTESPIALLHCLDWLPPL